MYFLSIISDYLYVSLARLVYHTKILVGLAVISIPLLIFSLGLNSLNGLTAALTADADKGIKPGIYFIDVGQGDSALYVSGTRGVGEGQNIILIDTGNDCAKLNTELNKILGGQKRIDLLFLTHSDGDHDGCAKQLTASYNISKIVLSPDYLLSDPLDTWLQNSFYAFSGDVFELKGVKIEVMYPVPDISQTEMNKKLAKDDNSFSFVLRIVDSINEIYMMGDFPKDLEGGIISSVKNILDRQRILKVGHHGSKNSTLPEFIEALRPDAAVLSYKKGNRYGHPNDGVVDLLSQTENKTENQTKIYRTESGTIYFPN